MTCNTLKKSIRCLACLALILALSLSLIPAPAYASAAMPDIGSSALLEFKAFGTIPVFNSADCSVRGCAAPQKKSYAACISAGDVCRISRISGGSVYVTYPTGSGSRSGYARIRDVFLADAPSGTFTAAAGCTVYSDTAGHSYGSVAPGDTVWVLGTSGSGTMVIYDAVSGSRRYKAGFVDAADLSRICPAPPAGDELSIRFACHVAQIGDQSAVILKPGCTVRIGTEGRGLAMEEITAAVESGDALLAMKVHAQDAGDSAMTEGRSVRQGSQGLDRRLEAVWIELRGTAAQRYTLEYRAHVQNVGWQSWVAAGQMAGTTGKGLRLESLEIRLTAKGGGDSSLRWPLTNSQVKSTSNDWNEYYSARPSRPYHCGVDLTSAAGDMTVYACADGTVAATGWNDANGNFVILKHTIGGRTLSFYCHLDSISAAQGRAVTVGERIGVVGDTGSGSKGAHLHFTFVDTLWSKGGYYGYTPYTGSESVTYDGVTYYNPYKIIGSL